MYYHDKFNSILANINEDVEPTLDECNYEADIINITTDDISPCKNNKELEDLPTNIMEILHTWQEFNIGNIFISSAPPFANIRKSMKCTSNYNEFIEHKQITAKNYTSSRPWSGISSSKFHRQNKYFFRQ